MNSNRIEKIAVVRLYSMFPSMIHEKLMLKAKEEFDISLPEDFYLSRQKLPDDIKYFRNYYFKNKSIIFVYNPYEITAFSYGAHHIEITYKELFTAFPTEEKLQHFLETLE